MVNHPVVELTSEASWNIVCVMPVCTQYQTNGLKIEDKFTPYGKEILAKLVSFLQVYVLDNLCVSDSLIRQVG